MKTLELTFIILLVMKLAGLSVIALSWWVVVLPLGIHCVIKGLAKIFWFKKFEKGLEKVLEIING